MKQRYILFLLSLMPFLLPGCVKDPDMDTDVKNAKVPTITTLVDQQQYPIEKGATTVSFFAEVKSGNGLPVDRYGVCWSTELNPSIESNDTTVCGSGITRFKGTAHNLLPNTTYYIRPYATNRKGTSYGEVITETTTKGLGNVNTVLLNDSIKAESIYCGGKIINPGEGPIRERGIYLTTPTKVDSVIPIHLDTDSFVCKIANLDTATHYTLRAYVTNDFGTFQGAPVEFRTTNGKSQLASFKKLSETYTEALFEAEVKTEGDSAVVARGFCWSEQPGVTLETGERTVNGSGKGIYSGTISPLVPAHFYYVRAYATNVYGTTYSGEIAFWTKSTLPRLSAVQIDAAQQGGTLRVAAEVLDEGESSVTESGVSYSLTPNDNSGNTKVAFSSGKGSYSGLLTNLRGSSTYYIRAYAVNEKGAIAYGEEATHQTVDIFSIKASFRGDNHFGGASSYTAIGSNGFMLGGDAGPDKTSEFWSYRSDRSDWLQLSPFPQKRKWQAVATLGVAVTAFGGMNSDNTETNDLHVYNSFSNFWEAIQTDASPRPQALSLSSAFTVRDTFFILGGAQAGRTVSDEIWSIYPENTHKPERWTKRGTFPVKQSRGIAFAIGDKVYAGLGINESGACNRSLWVADSQLTRWEPLSPISVDVRCGAAHGNVIYVADEAGYIWKYDLASNLWTRKSQLPAGRREAYCMYSLGGMIYITQGTTDSPILSYDPTWDN